MKAIHLTAGLAVILLSVVTASAANRGAPGLESIPIVASGGIVGKDVPGDFNEDLYPDLLLQNSYTGNLQVWLMASTKPMERIPTNPTGNGDASLIAVGTDDFDGDDRTDILFWRPAARNDPRDDRFPSTGGTLLVWHMDGVNALYKTEFTERVTEYEPVSVLDYNGDGDPDIVFQHRTGGDLFVWLLRGTAVIAKFPLSLLSAEMVMPWRVVGSGDFDRDGDFDLVLHRHGDARGMRGTGYDIVAVALMDGDVGKIVVVTEQGDRNWVIRSVADFTRDGWPDLFWENLMTGQTGVWEMEGLKITARYVVTTGSPSERGWHIVGPR